MNTLCLHKGAREVNAEQLANIFTPDRTETWVPIAHSDVHSLCRTSLEAIGYKVTKEQHALHHGNDRYFGLMNLTYDGAPADYGIVAGIRNSHDKSFPAGLVIGAQVFVCDNLSFSGEATFARKHTSRIMEHLPSCVSGAIGRLADMRMKQEQRIGSYKARGMGDTEVHDFVVRSMDTGILPTRLIPSVLKQWRNPNHAAFKPRNAWSLFNAYTETFKQTSPVELPKRTIALHGMFDLACQN